MFADDIKLYSSSANYRDLELDFRAIYDWTHDWMLPLNLDKCIVLHLGNNNPKYAYFVDNLLLSCTDSHVDLGVVVTSNLSWTEHIQRVASKANKMLFLLTKTFSKASPLVFSKLFKIYVRPLLKFANGVWSPILQKDILCLESIQRRATRFPFVINRPPYCERLRLMHLCPLSDRRKRGDLIIAYQALSNSLSPMRHLFPLNTSDSTRGHSLKLHKLKFCTLARQKFLTNRVFESWNAVPKHIVLASSTVSFKSKYDTYCATKNL
ncbi:hypothetical protein Zmor_018641 [Zophobas morio]|uniref:RNA-directed DNA polymerase from mobile element jockey n=1 Tax=Zophobas morio TaxID=2755281 RepID=A0AA38ICR1_9CUCU|nr:hypothetical protein Zmor_018641 [Zophobas morio]